MPDRLGDLLAHLFAFDVTADLFAATSFSRRCSLRHCWHCWPG